MSSLTTIDKVLFLKSVELFSAMPTDALARLAELAQEVRFEVDEAMLTEGQPGDHLYLILEGTVSIRVEGREVVTRSSGESIGEMSLIDSKPRSASVVAKTDVIALTLERSESHDLLEHHPDVARGTIRMLSRRLREALARQPDTDLRDRTASRW